MPVLAPLARSRPSAAYLPFAVRVLRADDLGPTTRRVVLGGAALAGFATYGPDQRIKLFLPRAGRPVPRLDLDDWWGAYRRLGPGDAPHMRTYTVRAFDAGRAELTVDFALHGDSGPASRWARRAVAGDEVLVVGPNAGAPSDSGVEWRPPTGARHSLVVGDATGLPAVGGIVESLAEGARATVVVSVPTVADRQRWTTRGRVSVHWCTALERLLDVVRGLELTGLDHAWVAGEAGEVRQLRRHLLGELGLAKDAVACRGYWRTGVAGDAGD